MKRFSCIGCGNCCKQTASEETNFPKFSGIVIQLRRPFVTIEEWNLKKLKDAADKIGIKLDTKQMDALENYTVRQLVEPLTVIFDLGSKKTIIINHTTTAEPCVFLDADNRCCIYEERPLICRAFPAPAFLTDMLVNKKIDIKWPSFCKGCPEKDEVKDYIVGGLNEAQLQFEKIIARLYEIWGESLVYRVQMESIAMAEVRAIEGLAKEGFIKPARDGYPLGYLSKRMAAAETITLSEFFERIGKGEERRKMVDEFRNSYNTYKEMVESACKKIFYSEPKK